MGKVYIVGVGPGDEELITIKAAKILKKCTVIFFDKDINNNILNFVNDKAKLICCGKGGNTTYKSSKEVTKAIISFSELRHNVARIVKGDPYEYGEEIDKVIEFKEAGINFEVIPAVSYPISTLNYSGIPLGRKGVTQDFHILYIKNETIERVNWEILCKESGVLIFNIKDVTIKDIIRNLNRNGKYMDSECAIIVNGTTSKQKKIVGRLNNILEKTKKENLKESYILVVGDVVEYHEKLDWFEEKPFFGLNICITKSQEKSIKLKEELKDLGADITEINTIRIKENPEIMMKYLGKLRSYKHIIFTSVSAVNIFFDFLIKSRYDIRKLKGSFSAVGKATKKALEKRGIVPFVVAKDGAGESLLRDISPYMAKGEGVLIPCSENSRQYLKEEIEKIGLYVDKLPIYEVEMGLLRDKYAIEKVDVILFTSPNTVMNLIEMVGLRTIKKKICIALGPQTERCLKDNNIKSVICEKYTKEGIIEDIAKLYNINIKKNLCEINDEKHYKGSTELEYRYIGISNMIKQF